MGINKILVFIFTIPFIVLILFKGILFYEQDTKQRYIKDVVDNTAYAVKITGVLTLSQYTEFKAKLNKMGTFQDANISLRKGVYVNGVLSNLTPYTLGEVLNKGDGFEIYVKSANVSNYSRMENGGVSLDETRNLYYKAKATVRIERYE